MGILAKKDMLYLLILYISISLLRTDLIFADDRGISFFKEEFQSEDCGPCVKEPGMLNPDLKKKTEEIERELKNNFTDKETRLNNEIILFIDPDSPFSDSAIDTLIKVKKVHPGWKIKGVLSTGLRGLKEKLLEKKSYFGNDIDFRVDTRGNMAREFNVTRLPGYVIIYHGKLYGITSQRDLIEVLSRLGK